MPQSERLTIGRVDGLPRRDMTGFKASVSTTSTVEVEGQRGLTAEDLVVFVDAVRSMLVDSADTPAAVSVNVWQGDSQRDGEGFKITGRWTR